MEDWFGDRDGGTHESGPPQPAWDADVPIDVPGQQDSRGAAAMTARWNWWIIGAIIALGMVILGGVMYLRLWAASSGDTSVHDERPRTETVEAAPASESKSLDNCHQEEPDRHGEQGVVVAFQQAYYSGDVARLEDLLAPESALQATNWQEVLDSAPPAEPCVTTMVVDEGVVEANVTVAWEKEKKTYLQEYYLVENSGVFFIDKIIDRSKK